MTGTPCRCYVCARSAAWTAAQLQVLVAGALLAGDTHVAQTARQEQRRRAATT